MQVIQEAHLCKFSAVETSLSNKLVFPPQPHTYNGDHRSEPYEILIFSVYYSKKFIVIKMYQRKLLSESDGRYVTGDIPQDDRFDDIVQIIENTLKTNSGKDFVLKHQRNSDKMALFDVREITNFVKHDEPKKAIFPLEKAHRLILNEKNLKKRSPKKEESKLHRFKMENDLDDILPHLRAIDKHFSCVKKLVEEKKSKIREESYSELINKLCKPYPFRKFQLSHRVSSNKTKSINFFHQKRRWSEMPDDIDKEISVLSQLQCSTKQLHDLALKKSSASCRCRNMKSESRDVIKELKEKYKDDSSKLCYAVLLDYPRYEPELSEAVESLQEIEKNIKSTMERIRERFLNFSKADESSEQKTEEKTIKKKKKCKTCTIF